MTVQVKLRKNFFITCNVGPHDDSTPLGIEVEQLPDSSGMSIISIVSQHIDKQKPLQGYSRIQFPSLFPVSDIDKIVETLLEVKEAIKNS